MNNILHFSSPANCFEESILLGNGTIGVTQYGGTKKEILNINESTFYSGYPMKLHNRAYSEAFNDIKNRVLKGRILEAEAINRYGFGVYSSQSFLPFGDIFIESDIGNQSTYNRTLNMQTGVSVVEFSGADYTVKRESFVNFKHNIFVQKTVQSGVKTVKINIDSKILHTKTTCNNKLVIYGFAPTHYVGNYEGLDQYGYRYEQQNDAKKGMKFCGMLGFTTNGEYYIENNTLVIKNATEYTVFYSAKTSYNGYNKQPFTEGCESYYSDCESLCNNAINFGYENLIKEHTEDFSALYNTTCFNIAEECTKPIEEIIKEKSLACYELLYNFGKYLTVSSSRSNSKVTTLQGIWNDKIDAPWHSSCTTNINTQMNYFPTLASGLTSCFIPYINLAKELAENGRDVAKKMYGIDGIICHHNTDIWRFAWPVGYFFHGAPHGSFNGSFLWIAAGLFEYYLYTGNKEFLENTAFPLTMEGINAYVSLLEEFDGFLAVTPSSSPENTYYKTFDGKKEVCTLCKHSALTNAIMREAVDNAISMCEILDKKQELAFLKELRPKLMPYNLTKDGRIMEWDQDYQEVDPHHRHVSHLYGLFPAREISPTDTPALAKACKKSLNTRGDGGTGWCIAWKANLWARLFDGNKALELIDNQLNLVIPSDNAEISRQGGTYPNLLCAHPPFQIDGNFGAMSALSELILQSRMEENTPTVCLLPALPDKFKQGEVKGLCAFGGFIVDTVWKNGKATSKITATRNSNIKIVAKNAEIYLNNALQNTPKITLNKGDVILAEYEI